MKIIYFSKSFFADCDFPLVKEMQDKGIDVRYYIPISKGFQNASILEFNKPWKKWGIRKASKMEDMHIYKDCVDLDRLYFISGYTLHLWDLSSWVLWIYVMFHIICQRAQVLHITWHLGRYERFLLYIPFGGKKVMTVHDPIQHSGVQNFKQKERDRKRCFKWADEFILLNKVQVDDFIGTYHIDRDRINVSHLGAYTSISNIEVPKTSFPKPYILFWGQINPYKGVEYLVEAMQKVHEHHKNVKLLIAGKGEVYFDMEKYKAADYITWYNRFIGVKELIGYIRDCEFAVCPYKDATQSGVVQTALALNTPVIVTNVGNLPSAVKDGALGMVVPPCDSESLADAICTLLETPEMLKKMKKSISKEWYPSMNWASIANDYLFVYTKR